MATSISWQDLIKCLRLRQSVVSLFGRFETQRIELPWPPLSLLSAHCDLTLRRGRGPVVIGLPPGLTTWHIHVHGYSIPEQRRGTQGSNLIDLF